MQAIASRALPAWASSTWDVAYEVDGFVSIVVTEGQPDIGTWVRDGDGWLSVPTTSAVSVSDWPTLVWDPHPHEWNRYPGLDSRLCAVERDQRSRPESFSIDIKCRPITVPELESIAVAWRSDGQPWTHGDGSPWLYSAAYDVGGYVSARVTAPYFNYAATFERADDTWYEVALPYIDVTDWPSNADYVWNAEQGLPFAYEWSPYPGLYSRLCVTEDQGYPWR